jgi:hypothetical protein
MENNNVNNRRAKEKGRLPELVRMFVSPKNRKCI